MAELPLGPLKAVFLLDLREIFLEQHQHTECDVVFIKNIKVSNFKSFEQINVDLGRFNVLIGANASGKSNFISIFRFLKDIVDSGLDNAISIQGGVHVFQSF